MTDPLIRPAVEADAADIARIYNQAVEHTTATFDTEPQPAEARLRVAAESTPIRGTRSSSPELGGAVVGLGVAVVVVGPRARTPRPSRPRPTSTRTAPAAGSGPRLTEAVLEAGRAGGRARRPRRASAPRTRRASRCPSRLGFFEVGVLHEVGWKFGRWLDVMMLEKLL